MAVVEAISLDDILAARDRIAGFVRRTPMVRLQVDDAPAEIYLKLENLQPIGSFKVRGASNALRAAGLAGGQLSDVFTASAGNMAQGVAYVARRLGVRASVVVPDHAPRAKLDAVERLGARIVKVPFDEWWTVLQTHAFDGLAGRFIHPVCDAAVIAGNGTIGLEILEECPDVDAIVVPFGGGGLSTGIATAVSAKKRGTRVFAAEVETAAPLAASLAAGHPRAVDYTPSFVDGIGGKSVLKEMWPHVSRLIEDSLVVSLEQIAEAIRTLALRNKVVTEGAGAASVAAALTGRAGNGKVVCVVSGGNVDSDVLSTILSGAMPGKGEGAV